MATMIIRDDTLWARNIEGDLELVRSTRELAANDAIVLRIDGRPIRFRKIEDDADGRIRPEPIFVEFWNALQSRQDALVNVEPERRAPDPYLQSLTATLSEWNSPEDAAAYDGL